MLIKSRALLKDIITCTSRFPPETGGILGGENDVITTYLKDRGMPNQNGCSYIPSTKYLNEELQKWEKRDISFMGIFHTHFHGVRTLSPGDKAYITDIMKAMPQYMTRLYFPVIVFPQEEMVAYVAICNNGEIKIIEDEVLILDRSVDL